MAKQVLKLMGAILATGAVLNIAGSGYMGQSVKKIAEYVTKGYGV